MTNTITGLYRYPVKSFGGQALTTAHLTTTGIPGDRCWAIRDNAHGDTKGGKRIPSLMGLQTRLNEEPSADNPSPKVTIELEDGRQLNSQDANIHQDLSAALEADVTLVPLDKAGDFGLKTPSGAYFDAAPLLIMTSNSLAALAQSHPEHHLDIRRFRPNLVIETTQAGFVENEWVGRTLRIGSVELKVEVRCPRCIMTTHGFSDLPQDAGILRSIVTSNDGDIGVYASVTEPGTIKLGDLISLQ